MEEKYIIDSKFLDNYSTGSQIDLFKFQIEVNELVSSKNEHEKTTEEDNAVLDAINSVFKI